MLDSESKKEIFSWIKFILAAVILAVVINKGVIINAKVPSGSMETTVMTDDRIIAFRWSYVFEEPKRGDIVIFLYPDDEQKLFVKRIIGVPGDHVEGIDGKVFVNGDALEEPYVNGVPTEAFPAYDVPEDSYFMMGDNRTPYGSLDSRSWENTYVKREKIKGKAIIKYYPSVTLLH